MASLNFEKLLVLSDILAGATSYGFSAVFDTPTYKKSVEAVVISIAARLLSTSFPNVTGGSMLTKTQKNELVVGTLSALSAGMAKRNIPRSVIGGVSTDLLAEMIFGYLNMPDTVIIGGGGAAAVTGTVAVPPGFANTGTQSVPFTTTGKFPTG